MVVIPIRSDSEDEESRLRCAGDFLACGLYDDASKSSLAAQVVDLVLHQYVRLAEQASENLGRLRVFEVERQALLGAVGPDKMRGLAAHAFVVGTREIAAARTLDLDHARAEIGKLTRTKRRGDRVLERNDGHTVEGRQVALH